MSILCQKPVYAIELIRQNHVIPDIVDFIFYATCGSISGESGTTELLRVAMAHLPIDSYDKEDLNSVIKEFKILAMDPAILPHYRTLISASVDYVVTKSHESF